MDNSILVRVRNAPIPRYAIGGLRMLTWLVLSPTRFVVDRLKRRRVDPEVRAAFLWKWNWGFFLIELAVALALMTRLEVLLERGWPWVPGVLGWLALGRCNEIVYAFYRDATRVLAQTSASSSLTPAQRVQMAMRSYIGLLINFAVIAYTLPRTWYHKEFTGFFDAVYFSGITLSTTGYGDILPVCDGARFIALYEVFAGMLLVIVALAVYLSSQVRLPSEGGQGGGGVS